MEEYRIICKEIKRTNQYLKNLKKITEDIKEKINEESSKKNMEIDKLKGINEYDKIVLKNLESRISILEEETQKYNII